MTDLENHRRAVSRLLAGRILEDESLTADLTDQAAKVLLDWGLAQAEVMAQQVEGHSQEGLWQPDARLATLRRTMKRISRQAGKVAPEAQMERVRALLAEIETEQTLEVENDA